MELVNTKQMFKDCIHSGYAVGAFNFVNLETLKSIVSTADEMGSPVIVQCSTGGIKYAGLEEVVAMVKAVASKVKVPVCLNLDHGATFEECKRAIDAGFTNVMIDASKYPMEQNIALTQQVVEYAHARNVTVEAEIGVLAGVEDEVSAEQNIYTDPQQAKDFVELTGCDSLAIAIGTSHGTVKFSGEAKLQFNILKKIEELLPDFPLVLHGASSIPKDMVALAEQFGAVLSGANGIPEEMLRKACEHNICKINVDSDLRIAYTAGVREHLILNPDNVDIRKYNQNGMKYIKETVSHKMKEVFMSADRARIDSE